ncbi:MAG: hypothetical protein AB8I69_06815 [Anaerolineae bacterium]|jgi:hypothetical protein
MSNLICHTLGCHSRIKWISINFTWLKLCNAKRWIVGILVYRLYAIYRIFLPLALNGYASSDIDWRRTCDFFDHILVLLYNSKATIVGAFAIKCIYSARAVISTNGSPGV